RDIRFDNYKGILITLVVIGHFLWGYRDIELYRQVCLAIYLFHMPAFVLISGYFSKPTIKAVSICQLLVSFFIVNTLMMVFSVLVLGADIHLLSPYYSCWYLLALVAWRLLLPAATSVKSPLLMMVLSVLLAISVGFCDEITNEFALSRIISFFPFFLLGYYLRNEEGLAGGFTRLMNWPGAKVLGFLVFILGLCLGIFLINRLGIVFNDELMSPYGEGLFSELARRFAVFAFALLCSLSLLLCMPNREIRVISRSGRNSLTVYLFHRVISLVFLLMFPTLGLSPASALLLAIASLATVYVLGLNPLARAYGGFVLAITTLICNPEGERRKRTALIAGFVLLVCLFFAASGLYSS
ncbi:MAG: acyltransferase family protein, partial [Eggerthellaceae bacterium]|nr:acyltransferase family protein [Eggerthellaceae bacterium]